jgi:hypothetical protein
MLAVLTIIAAGAAAGLRTSLPLLVIGILETQWWQQMPFLNAFPSHIVLGILSGLCFLELIAGKQFLGQRVNQIYSLIASPFVGAIMSIAAAKLYHSTAAIVGIAAIVGGLLALVLQLVQMGWFFRLRGLPIWSLMAMDLLSVSLAMFALRAPISTGIIGLLLLWMAVRSAGFWYRWYHGCKKLTSTLA